MSWLISKIFNQTFQKPAQEHFVTLDRLQAKIFVIMKLFVIIKFVTIGESDGHTAEKMEIKT